MVRSGRHRLRKLNIVFIVSTEKNARARDTSTPACPQRERKRGCWCYRSAFERSSRASLDLFLGSPSLNGGSGRGSERKNEVRFKTFS